jgi:hypothetical protein
MQIKEVFNRKLCIPIDAQGREISKKIRVDADFLFLKWISRALPVTRFDSLPLAGGGLGVCRTFS